MGLREHLTPLSRLSGLSDGERASLTHAHVTSVEDLVGLLESDRPGLAELLGRPQSALEPLAAEAWDALDADTRAALRASSGQHYAYGAWDPDAD
jgi:hypothetical protein